MRKDATLLPLILHDIHTQQILLRIGATWHEGYAGIRDAVAYYAHQRADTAEKFQAAGSFSQEADTHTWPIGIRSERNRPPA